MLSDSVSTATEVGMAGGGPRRHQERKVSASPVDGDKDLSTAAAIRALIGQIPVARRRALAPLIALLLVGAVAEVATLGALLPFLAAIADPGSSQVLPFVSPILNVFNLTEPGQAVYVLTGLFALAAIVSGTLRLALLWASSKFTNGVAYDLAVRLYDKVLHEPYSFHTRRNSSEIIAAINKVEMLAGGVLSPVVQGAAALVIALFIAVGLVAIDPIPALAAGLGFLGIYFAATSVTRKGLSRNSQVISRAQTQRVKFMQEGLGGIRDVLLDQSQTAFLEDFENAMADLRDARTWNAFYTGSPRFIVEALGIIMIAAMAVIVTSRPGGLTQAVPLLGALALGAQRLLPLVQQVYSGWASVTGNRKLVHDVLEILRGPGQPSSPATRAKAPLPFRKEIRFKDVHFRYSDDAAPTISGIDLVIPKGAHVGIVGKTGSGKSTLLDLLLGLLEPTSGHLLIDDVVLTGENRIAWQRSIAHVPQSIFLTDTSIAENIAFGVRKQDVNHEAVRRAAEQARLADFIETLPNGFDTRVGERGVQLSGGQRQRVGIARALYKQAKVLVFDEATSALDHDTEAAVMTAIEALDPSLTIIMVAHRLSTLEACDLVVEVVDGRVTDTSVPEGRSSPLYEQSMSSRNPK